MAEFGKDPLSAAAGHSEAKEVRDFISAAPEMHFHSQTLAHPDTAGWDIQTSNEVSADGRSQRSETIAKTDGVEKISGGIAEFKGLNEQRSSATHEGDDRNYVKKASESSNTHLQEKVVIGDEKSGGRTEVKMSSTTSSSSTSKVISSSSTSTEQHDESDYLNERHLTNKQQLEQQQQQLRQKQLRQEQQQQQHEQQHEQRDEHYTEEYKNVRQESKLAQKIETEQLREESKRYIDMDKASPEYQRHVQQLMAQPGEIISNTVEYPKPNVKMITTVKRLPDGTIVKNKRYETEETQPPSYAAEEIRSTSRSTTALHDTATSSTSRNQSVNQRRTSNDHRPTMGELDETQYRSTVEEDVAKHVSSSVKTSTHKYTTEMSSETVKEFGEPPASQRAQPDFSTHGFPSVKADKFTQEYPTDRCHPARRSKTPEQMQRTSTKPQATQDDATEELIVVKSQQSSNIKHKASSERLIETEIISGRQPFEDTPARAQTGARTTTNAAKADYTTHGFPSVVECKKSAPLADEQDELSVRVSKESKHTSAYKTNSERIVETELTGEPAYSTHGYPSVVRNEQHATAPRAAGKESGARRPAPPSQDFSTHGFPSVGHEQPKRLPNQAETSRKLIQKEREVDAAHRAFAASLRSSSPADSNASSNASYHQQQQPRQLSRSNVSTSSAKTYSRRDMREGSHDSNANSELSRISGATTITRTTPTKTTPKSTPTKTAARSHNSNSNNENNNYELQRKSQTPSPAPTAGTRPRTVTAAGSGRSTTVTTETVAKPDKLPQYTKPADLFSLPTTNITINATKLTNNTKQNNNNNNNNKDKNSKQKLVAVVDTTDGGTSAKAIEEPLCVKRDYYKLGPGEAAGDQLDGATSTAAAVAREIVEEVTAKAAAATATSRSQPKVTRKTSAKPKTVAVKQTTKTGSDDEAAVELEVEVEVEPNIFDEEEPIYDETYDEITEQPDAGIIQNSFEGVNLHEILQTTNTSSEFIKTEREHVEKLAEAVDYESSDGALISRQLEDDEHTDSTNDYRKKGLSRRETFEDRCRKLLGMEQDGDTQGTYKQTTELHSSSEPQKNPSAPDNIKIEDCLDDDDDHNNNNGNGGVQPTFTASFNIIPSETSPHVVVAGVGARPVSKSPSPARKQVHSSPERARSERHSKSPSPDYKYSPQELTKTTCTTEAPKPKSKSPTKPTEFEVTTEAKLKPKSPSPERPQTHKEPLDSPIRASPERCHQKSPSPTRHAPSTTTSVQAQSKPASTSKTNKPVASNANSQPSSVELTEKPNSSAVRQTNKPIIESNTEPAEEKRITKKPATPADKRRQSKPTVVTTIGNRGLPAAKPTREPTKSPVTKLNRQSKVDVPKSPRRDSLRREPYASSPKSSRKGSDTQPQATIKDRLRSSMRKYKPKADDVDGQSTSTSPENSPTRGSCERRRSSANSSAVEIISEYTGTSSAKSSPVPSRKPLAGKDKQQSVVSRRLPVTERKESAPLPRTTARREKDTKMSRSTSENIIRVHTAASKPAPGQPKIPEIVTSSAKPQHDRTAKTNGETMTQQQQQSIIVVDTRQAKSSREPSPDKLIPTPVPINLETGKPRYPDSVQEPEDEPRRQPIVTNVPIFEEDTREFVGCQISEISTQSLSSSQHEYLDNPTVEAPISLDYTNAGDECLLSVHEKVNKFISTAEAFKQPKSSTPFSRQFDDNVTVAEDDDCLLSIDQKVNKFLKTAEEVSRPVASSSPSRELERTEIDEQLREDDCSLSVSQKVHKFIDSAEKLAPTTPQRSPQLVASVERSISRPNEPVASELKPKALPGSAKSSKVLTTRTLFEQSKVPRSSDDQANSNSEDDGVETKPGDLVVAQDQHPSQHQHQSSTSTVTSSTVHQAITKHSDYSLKSPKSSEPSSNRISHPNSQYNGTPNAKVEPILGREQPRYTRPSAAATDTVAARRNIFENRSSPKSGAKPAPMPNTPTPATSGGRRPSYMEHTKCSLEHMRRDSLELNKTNYTRKSSLEDETNYERNPNSAVKFDVPRRSSRKDQSNEQQLNIEEIFELQILEELLETVTAYELRRRIRAQIRLVKKRAAAQTEPAGNALKTKTPAPAYEKSVSSKEQVDHSTEQLSTHRSGSTQGKPPVKPREQSLSPARKSTSTAITTTTTTTTTSTRDRSRSPKQPTNGVSAKPTRVNKSKPKADDKPEKPSTGPIWADRRNVLRKTTTTSTASTTKTAAGTTTSTSSARNNAAKTQIKNSNAGAGLAKEEESIISSYGIGPTDEHGLPLFGIRALKKKQQSVEPSETTEVTGYVIEEKYYSDCKTKPTVERKELIYSSNADELAKLQQQLDKEHTKELDDDERVVLREFKKIDSKALEQQPSPAPVQEPPAREIPLKTPTNVRRGSVKEISEKFIRKESSSSLTESKSSHTAHGNSTTTYPKAGLILRTTSRQNSKQAADDQETTREVDNTSDVDSEPVDEARSVIDVAADCGSESVTLCKKTTQLTTSSKAVVQSTRSSSTRSFLNTSGEERYVTGVDDVIERMRNADNVVEDGDTADDREARALLNKFLGASVLMQGVESVLPGVQSHQQRNIKTTRITTSYANKDTGDSVSLGGDKRAIKTTRITKSIQSGNSSTPVTRTTCDIEEIWDEEILKQLLEAATTYEERRKIRARLRELMADREAKSESPSQLQSSTTTERIETKADSENGAVATTITKVTTRTVSGKVSASKDISSPFAKFQQLERENSQQSPKSPTTPNSGTSAPIFKFTDPALNARAATVKDQLLQWCQNKTQEYENVEISNFSSSWSNGLAFCALIHHFLPEAFDYNKLTPENRQENFELAFKIADEKADIAPLLDVEDMVAMKRPDWKCVFIYVQSIYRRFRNCQ